MSDLASEVRIEEEEPQAPRLSAITRIILMMLAVTEMGPTDGSVLKVSDQPDFERKFGGWTIAGKDGRAAIAGFFDEGGSEAYVGRVVHTSVQGDPTTKISAKGQLTLTTPSGGAVAGRVTSSIAAPYDMEPGQTIIVDRDALGTATATFNATAGTRLAANTGPYVMTNGMTLTVSIDGGGVQTIQFLTAEFAAIGAATATEVAAVLAAKLVGASATVDTNAPRITSDKRGTGSGVNVTGGTANAVLGYVVGNSAGTGNVANIDAVSSAEFETVVEAAVSGVTVTEVGGLQRITSNTNGATSMVQVTAGSTADTVIGFDNAQHFGNDAGTQNTLRVDGRWDGVYAAEITVQVLAATSGNADEFNFTVLRNGIAVERFANLSLDAASPRYALTVVNDENVGSKYIVLVNLDSTIESPGNLPDVGTFGPLAGGNDGLAGLADTDYIGGVTSNGRTGLRMFDAIDGDVLIVPGRATGPVHNAMLNYCEITRGGLMFTVLDCPAGQTDDQMVTYVKTTAAIYNVSEYGAIYWPRVTILNPAKGVYGSGSTMVVPPSGIIAGIIARVAQSKDGGSFDHPAGEDRQYRPRTVQGLEPDPLTGSVTHHQVLDKASRDKVFPMLINPIQRENSVWFIDGARTTRDTGNFPTLGQRLGVISVEKVLKKGLVFLRHRNMRTSFYQRGIRAVTVYMNSLAAADALGSKKPSEAYVFDFGPGLNKPSTRKARRAVARLGISTTEPGEFIIIRVGPDNRALDAELAAENGA